MTQYTVFIVISIFKMRELYLERVSDEAVRVKCRDPSFGDRCNQYSNPILWYFVDGQDKVIPQ